MQLRIRFATQKPTRHTDLPDLRAHPQKNRRRFDEKRPGRHFQREWHAIVILSSICGFSAISCYPSDLHPERRCLARVRRLPVPELLVLEHRVRAFLRLAPGLCRVPAAPCR